ncbi:MAG: hypothetical protein EXR28_06015 [Betaproteobacteria bacterium]|nr:hypothetical protein [Betaproteobacteria bacterium]
MRRTVLESGPVLRLALAWLVAMLCATLPHAVRAQAYPVKPVRLIVPAAPGGGLDLIGRMMADQVSEIWSQQMLVENRPGANFIVGTDAVVKSTPDGYTFLFTPGTAITINPAVFPDLPHSPLRELIPITLVARRDPGCNHRKDQRRRRPCTCGTGSRGADRISGE